MVERYMDGDIQVIEYEDRSTIMLLDHTFGAIRREYDEYGHIRCYIWAIYRLNIDDIDYQDFSEWIGCTSDDGEMLDSGIVGTYSEAFTIVGEWLERGTPLVLEAPKRANKKFYESNVGDNVIDGERENDDDIEN